MSDPIRELRQELSRQVAEQGAQSPRVEHLRWQIASFERQVRRARRISPRPGSPHGMTHPLGAEAALTPPTLGEALHTRLSLAALEFERERVRLRRNLLWGAVIGGCLVFALLALQGLLVLLWWEQAGPWTLAALAAAWGMTALLSAWNWQRQHQTDALPFAQTVAVLRADLLGISNMLRNRQP